MRLFGHITSYLVLTTLLFFNIFAWAGGNAYRLEQNGVQVIQLGDQVKLVLPSDRLFDVNSPRLNPNNEHLLKESIRFINSYGDVPLTIAGFTDNVAGMEHDQKLTRLQAQRVLAYLWSHGGIDWRRMHVVAYGKAGAVSTNRNAIGSAQNRRIEISWRQKTGSRGQAAG